MASSSTNKKRLSSLAFISKCDFHCLCSNLRSFSFLPFFLPSFLSTCLSNCLSILTNKFNRCEKIKVNKNALNAARFSCPLNQMQIVYSFILPFCLPTSVSSSLSTKNSCLSLYPSQSPSHITFLFPMPDFFTWCLFS